MRQNELHSFQVKHESSKTQQVKANYGNTAVMLTLGFRLTFRVLFLTLERS